MKFQKVSEFAKQIPTGFRNRAERNEVKRECGNFEIFLNNPLFVILYIQAKSSR